MAQDSGYLNRRKRPSVPILVLIALLHVLAFYGLMKALAPDIAANVENSVLSSFSVTVTAPPPEPTQTPPSPEPEPDEGEQGDPGRDAVPQPVTAPTPKIRLKEDPPQPKVSSTGTQDSAGAAQTGSGTGAAGSGDGLGSGRGGDGRGGIVASKPVKIAGDINSARDYPRPPGGRESRFGQSVTIVMTVGVDGRASDCRVKIPSNDPVADRVTCDLAISRFRFRPARDQNGDPVPAPYGWRQSFFAKK